MARGPAPRSPDSDCEVSTDGRPASTRGQRRPSASLERPAVRPTVDLLSQSGPFQSALFAPGPGAQLRHADRVGEQGRRGDVDRRPFGRGRSLRRSCGRTALDGAPRGTGRAWVALLLGPHSEHRRPRGASRTPPGDRPLCFESNVARRLGDVRGDGLSPLCASGDADRRVHSARLVQHGSAHARQATGHACLAHHFQQRARVRRHAVRMAFRRTKTPGYAAIRVDGGVLQTTYHPRRPLRRLRSLHPSPHHGAGHLAGGVLHRRANPPSPKRRARVRGTRACVEVRDVYKRQPIASGCSARRTVERSSSTRSPSCRSPCRSSSCASSRRERYAASARPPKSRWTSAYSLRPTGTWKTTCATGASGRRCV